MAMRPGSLSLIGETLTHVQIVCQLADGDFIEIWNDQRG